MTWPINPSRYAVDSPGTKDLFKDIIDQIALNTGDISSIINASNVPPVPNGSFEIDAVGVSQPTGWTMVPKPGGSGVVTNTDADHGQKSYRATHPGGAFKGGVELTTTDFMPVSVGQGFELYISTRATNANVSSVVLAYFYDANQALIAGSPVNIINIIGNYPTAWRWYKGIVEPTYTPSHACFMKLAITLGTTGMSTAADIFLDNVCLVFRRPMVNYVAFTSPGSFSWTPPPGVNRVRVILRGGGQSGRLGTNTNVPGAGGLCEGFIDVFPTVTLGVVVGANSPFGNFPMTPAFPSSLTNPYTGLTLLANGGTSTGGGTASGGNIRNVTAGAGNAGGLNSAGTPGSIEFYY